MDKKDKPFKKTSDDKFLQLLTQLKSAHKECLGGQIALHEAASKYAPLCIQILIEGRQIPRLINNRIEERKRETRLDPVHPDFWDADMIIALHNHYESHGILEDLNGSS